MNIDESGNIKQHTNSVHCISKKEKALKIITGLNALDRLIAQMNRANLNPSIQRRKKARREMPMKIA